MPECNLYMSTLDHKGLTPLKKVLLFAVIFLMFGVYQMVMNLIVLNMGIGELRYPTLFLQVLPGLYIIHRNFWKLSLEFPHVIIFILMVSAFVLYEGFISPLGEDAARNYQFIFDQTRIYIFFLMLVNFGLDRATFNKVIDFTLYCGVLICLITYAGYLGFFKINVSDLPVEFLQAKPDHITYVNFVSLQCAFAILLLIIKQLNEKRFSSMYILRDLTLISLLFGLTIINASRGAILISIILVCYYFYFLLRNGIRDIKIKAFIILFIVISGVSLFESGNTLENLGSSQSDVYVVEHFKEFDFATRALNIFNAWENFRDYPLTGVGYEYAAVRDGIGTRSNTQYLQMLASSGIIFFTIYIFYNFKLAVCSLNLLKRPEVVLCLTYLALYLLFEKPLDMTAVLGYIAFYFYSAHKQERAEKGRSGQFSEETQIISGSHA